MRCAVFRQVNGYQADLIAGEMCGRIRALGKELCALNVAQYRWDGGFVFEHAS